MRRRQRLHSPDVLIDRVRKNNVHSHLIRNLTNSNSHMLFVYENSLCYTLY